VQDRAPQVREAPKEKPAPVRMKRLPLRGVAEVAFLAANVNECLDFYKKIGLVDFFPVDATKPGRFNFANVGEQLFGVCDEKEGFIDGHGGFVKSKLHVAFEIPAEKLDESISFLETQGINVSPKTQAKHFHGVAQSTSVYIPDPAGNIIELWAPRR
jgi:catechol 2,3-dioxygenase-like lactoylglutathione lyase family enzyme